LTEDDSDLREAPDDDIKQRDTRLARAWLFLRSVMPEDPWQLVYLAGLVCLTVSPKLRWHRTLPTAQSASSAQQAKIVLLYFVAMQFNGLSAASGYAACLWSPRRPAKRLLWTVCFPAVLGIAGFLAWKNSLEIVSGSVLARESWASNFASSIPQSWGSGPGLHYCVFGILLIACFASRVWLTISRFPLTLRCDNARKSIEPFGPGPKTLLWHYLSDHRFRYWGFRSCC